MINGLLLALTPNCNLAIGKGDGALSTDLAPQTKHLGTSGADFVGCAVRTKAP